MATHAPNSFEMLIDGQGYPTASRIDVRNPATGEVFATAPDANAADLDRAVAAATRAFEAWKLTPIADRKAALKHAATIIDANAEELAHLFVKEQGRPF